MKKWMWILLLCAPSWLVAAIDSSWESPDVEVRYLGGNGWAVTIDHRMLIFDYQEETDPSPPAWRDRNLSHGYITADELTGYEVTVFVTHSHFDHYDRVIYEWENQLESITYLFGWAAGSNPEHLYLDAWRESASINGMDITTIYSHHNDVPEVAYLVRVEGLTIYHNGDYRADYADDFAYLATLTDTLDIAFLIGHPYPEHAYFRQALRMAELFDVSFIFPMNREGEAFRCHDYARLLAEYGVAAAILVAEERGETFTLSGAPEQAAD